MEEEILLQEKNSINLFSDNFETILLNTKKLTNEQFSLKKIYSFSYLETIIKNEKFNKKKKQPEITTQSNLKLIQKNHNEIKRFNTEQNKILNQWIYNNLV